MNRLAYMLFVLLLLMIQPVIAYTQSANAFRLKAWTTFTSCPWQDSVYRFKTFRDGYIVVPNKNIAAHKQRFNYNLYTERVEVIGESNDTISLDNNHTFKFVMIGNTPFYNHSTKGFIEIILQDTISLGAKRFFETTMESANGERFKITDLRNATSRYDRIYEKVSTYYFIDTDGHLFTPTPHNTVKLFPGRKNKIKRYLKLHHTNFKHPGDLEQLLMFCSTAETAKLEK